MKYTWILILLFSCQTKSTHMETESDTASSEVPAAATEEPGGATLAEMPMGIEGTYVMEESRDCNLQISIFKSGPDYSYELKTSKRNVKGKVSFTKGEAIEEMYINFSGFPGDDSGVGNKKTNDENLNSLEALYSDGALDIQNSGNAMNTYEKFAECSDKFIHLEKKK
jgi:hypothetical protein